MMPASSRPPGASPSAEAIRAGTLAGLAMIPFAAVFRARGLRINEYGRKTLELVVGAVPSPRHEVLTFVEHLLVSWVLALPAVPVLRRLPGRGARAAVGAVYGGGLYVGLNSFALPFAFGDPTPWTLGWRTILPSLVVHLVYGVVLGLAVRPLRAAGR